MKQGGVVFSIRTRELRQVLLIFLIVNVPLLIFFFDYYNLNVTIYGASVLFLGINPYEAGTQIVAGYLILPYNLFSFLVYYFSNFSILISYVALKVVGLFFVVLTAIFVLKTIGNESKLKKSIVFSSIVLSPLILFVSDVGMSTIPIPMFLILLSFYMIFFSRSNSNLSLFTGALALALASFMYYFPTLLIPSYLVYASGKGKRIRLLAFVMLLGLFFELLQYYFRLSSTFIGVLTGGYPTMYPYSILNLLPAGGKHFVLEHQLIVTIILIFLAFLIPILTKYLHVPLTMSIVLLLTTVLLLQPNGTYPDSYMVLVPFIVIIFGKYSENRVGFAKILLPQLFVLPEFMISQLLNGPGYVTGIFYSLYTILHYNILVYDIIPGARYVWMVLLILTVIFAFISLAYLWKLTRTPMTEEFQTFTTGYVHTNCHTVRKRLILIAVLLVVFVLVVPILAENDMRTTSAVNSRGVFPAMLFIPSSSTSVYWMPSPNTYEISGGRVEFFSQSPSAYFYRDLSEQNMKLSFSLNVSDWNRVALNEEMPILTTNLFKLSAEKTGNTTYTSLDLKLKNTLNGQEKIYPYQNEESIGVTSLGNRTSMSIGGSLVTFPEAVKQISIGKMSDSAIALTFTFETVEFNTVLTSHNYLIIVISLSGIVPALLFCIYFSDYRVARRRRYHDDG